MMISIGSGAKGRPCRVESGLTLVEVVVAFGISVVAVLGIISGYLFGVASAQRSSLSMAATARALQRIEQTRGAQWDSSRWPAADQLLASNFPVEVVSLRLDTTGKPAVYATNFIDIESVSVNPPLKKIRADCVWSFNGIQLLTNTIETCRAPDQ
jgi:Tfp pilus assembly protein PilV